MEKIIEKTAKNISLDVYIYNNFIAIINNVISKSRVVEKILAL